MKNNIPTAEEFLKDLQHVPDHLYNNQQETGEYKMYFATINPLIPVDGGEKVLIIPDEETWDDIFKNICDQDLVTLYDIWNWLKQNYEVPKRK